MRAFGVLTCLSFLNGGIGFSMNGGMVFSYLIYISSFMYAKQDLKVTDMLMAPLFYLQILNQMTSASVLSLPLPLMIFLWAMLSVPRPSKTFWVVVPRTRRRYNRPPGIGQTAEMPSGGRPSML